MHPAAPLFSDPSSPADFMVPKKGQWAIPRLGIGALGTSMSWRALVSASNAQTGPSSTRQATVVCASRLGPTAKASSFHGWP